MRRARVIPVIGLENRKMVKTVRFKKPRYLGDPVNAIKIFNDKEVDEICVLDIRASMQQREPDYEHIYEMAGEAFMPMGYGGGIQTFAQAQKVFACGVEKVVINSGHFLDHQLIHKIADTYGEQSVVLSLDVTKNWRGRYIAKWMSGKKKSASLRDLLETIPKLPIGEVIVHQIDREGTFLGPDLALIKEVTNKLPMPVVPLGGFKSLSNMVEAFHHGASAVAAASLFSFKNNNPESILINYPSQEELKAKIFLNLPEN